MRPRVVLLLLIVSLSAVALHAANPVISNLAPHRFSVRSGDQVMRISVNYFAGPAGAAVVFDGPAGRFQVAPSGATTSYLDAAVPQAIVNTVGVHSVQVVSPAGSSAAVPFEVLEQGRSGEIPAPIVAEATGPNGAAVTFHLPAGVTCSHSSGATFPLGTTTVQCSEGDFTITVRDTTAPSLTVPGDFSVPATGSAGAVVTYQASAVDLVDGSVAVQCAPPSGATFAVGQTQVNCSATDSRANASAGSFKVTVVQSAPPKPPRLELPQDITEEATGPNGAVVRFTAAAYPGGDDHNGRPLQNVACNPPSGSTFALGTTTVTCTATDPESQTSSNGSFNVTVLDRTAPVLSLPRDLTVQGASAGGANVTFTASANDLVDGSVAVTCDPASGSNFPIGVSTVQCSASDSRGNSSSGSFQVTVTETVSMPPRLVLPSDMTIEATGSNGAVATFTAYAYPGADDHNGRPLQTVVCAPPSGSTFPLGTTTVSCSASDPETSASTAGSFKITVVDTTAPALVLPADITVAATSASGADVTYSASASDLVDGSVAVSCAPASGSTFAIRTTLVSCTASDSRANTSSGAFNVTVTGSETGDTTPPVITSISASPDVLVPANHKLVSVTISATATDETDPAPIVRIYDVTANEAVDAPGSGNTNFDWQITGPLTLDLRAERSGQGQDRVYTVWVEAIDASGNRSTTNVTVRVPKDNNQSAPVQSPPASRRRAGGK